MAVGAARAHLPSRGGTWGTGCRRGERTTLRDGSSNHCILLECVCPFSLLLVSRPLRTAPLLRSGYAASSPLLRKTVQFPEDSATKKSAANYCFLFNVANARNACRKFSTGMIGKSPACRRASAAFSPAGTRKTSAPDAPRPDHLLLHAADREHVAVELDLARRRHLEPAVDVAAQLLDDVEREREPGRGAADAGQVDLDVDRQLDVRELLDLDPDDRPPFSSGSRSCRPRSPWSRRRAGRAA